MEHQPVQAELAYATPTASRPGMVSAIGITSIVVASLSLIGIAYFALMLFSLAMVSSMTAFNTAGTVTPAGDISASDADVIITALNSSAAIPPAEQTLLKQALQSLDFPLDPPADGVWTQAHVTGQITTSSTTQTNVAGTPMASTNFMLGGNGFNTIDISAGLITVNYIDANGDFTTAYYNNTGPTVTNMGNIGGPTISSSFFWLQSITTGLSLLLVALLLIAGIQMTRGRPSGYTLHWWWIPLKLVVAILAAASMFLLVRSFILDSQTQPGGGPSTVTGPLIGAAIMFGVSAAWPIAVFFMLRTQSVRNYFNAAEAEFSGGYAV